MMAGDPQRGMSALGEGRRGKLRPCVRSLVCSSNRHQAGLGKKIGRRHGEFYSGIYGRAVLCGSEEGADRSAGTCWFEIEADAIIGVKLS